MVTVCAISLLAGFALKAQCLALEWDGSQYSRLCYNDIQPLYALRAVEETFPYINGELAGVELAGGAIEYPVLTGVFMWLAAQVASSSAEYLRVTAALLAPFGLLVAYLLGRMSGRRALLWSAAPAIVLYAFHNWDLLVVAAAVAGFFAWWRRRYGWAGVWFGVGAALKMFPLIFAVPLALERLVARDRKGAMLVLGAAVGVTAAINLPFALYNFDGWWATYAFHRQRTANWDAIWTWFPFDLPGPPFDLNLLTSVLTAASFTGVLVAGRLRARAGGAYPFLQVSAALLASFLLFNKVHSPQYTLWILPFFALLRVRWGWWAAYAIVDLVVYVGVFRWFFDLSQGVDTSAMTAAKALMISGVWARAALLAALIPLFLRRDPGVDGGAGRGSEIQSHPSSTVPAVETQPA